MADRNERVMEMVRRELERDPEVGLNDLMAKAREIDPAVAEMTPRQFHARYPLQIKRSRGGPRPRKEKPATKRSGRARAAEAGSPRSPRPTGGREAIRAVLLEFASDFAQAESRQEIVRVLSNIDTYVDRVQKVAGRG